MDGEMKGRVSAQEIGSDLSAAASPARNRVARSLFLLAVLAAVALGWWFFLRDGPRPPDLRLSSNDHDHISISWEEGRDRKGNWVLQRAVGERGDFEEIAEIGPDQRSYTDSATVPNSVHRYRLSARDADGKTVDSKVLSALALPAGPVQLVSRLVSPSEIELRWVYPGKALPTFQIERRSEGGEFMPMGEIAGGTSYLDRQGVSPDTRYQYRVRASNRSGNSAYSNPTEVVTPPDTPAGLAARALSGSSVGLSWRAETSQVTVQRKGDGSGFRDVAKVAHGFSYQDDGLQPGTLYVYRITVDGLDGGQVHSDGVSVLTHPAAPERPTTSSASPSEIELAWDAVDPTVSSIQIERRSDTEEFSPIAQVPSAARSHLDTGLDSNAGYTYRLRAVNASGVSDYSPEAAAMTLPEAPLDLRAIPLEAARVELSWFNPDGLPIPIQVQRQRGVGGPVTMMKVDPGQAGIVDEDLIPNTVYVYRVRAENAAGFSQYSESRMILTLPASPRGLTLQADSTTSLTLSWQAPLSPPAPVVVERASNDTGAFSPVARLDPGATSHIDQGLQPNTTYRYRLHAVNDSGPSDASDPVEAVTLPQAPSEVAAVLSPSEGVAVDWSYPSPVAGFRVERDEGDGIIRQVASPGPAETGFVDRSVAPNRRYRYRVRAFNRSGVSQASQWIEVLTLPVAPSQFEALAVSPFQVRLTWREDGGTPAAVGIERREGRGSFEEVVWLDPGLRAYLDAAVLPDRLYEYRLVAANDSGYSGYSGPIRVATPPLPLAQLRLKKDRIVAGESVAAVVSLSHPAPPAGWVVGLESSDRTVAPVPNALEFRPGEVWREFTIDTTRRLRNLTEVRISVESAGRISFVNLSVEPPAPPDPAAERIEFMILRRGRDGRILVRGVIRNLGPGDYEGKRGRQSAQLFEVTGGGRKLIAEGSFNRLDSGQRFSIQAELPFDFGTEEAGNGENSGAGGFGRRGSPVAAAPSVAHPPDPSGRRVPPQYRLVIVYSSALQGDADRQYNDQNPDNNQLTRSGADILREQARIPLGEPF